MKLTHNFRSFSRSISRNFENIGRGFMVLAVLFVFFIGLLFVSSRGFLQINENGVLGTKSGQDIDIRERVNRAALDISQGNFREANRQLAIILEFEPNNVYAIEMKGKLVLQIKEVESEILKTLRIIEMQPNWKEAWVKLAELYEKVGNSNLAAEAREKARSLKTS